MRGLVFRPAVGWYGVVGIPPRLLGGMRGLVFRPGFLRLMLRFTHTTQPTGSNCSNHRVGWVLGVLQGVKG